MSPRTDRATAYVALATALVCLVLTVVRAQPPAPRDPEPGEFSAINAQRTLEDLYANESIHPVGTESNRHLKEEILEHLRQSGYDPTVQSTLACWESGGCGHVENILARLEGQKAGKAVLLAVHYDGVGAGPSISDDGVAVAAALEIARLLKSGPQLDNDVIFLIDDSEEAFLLGAVAFAAEHPWAAEVGAVVNLEARGTTGRSYMFETDSDNAWLIDLMKRYLPRPASSSLFYSIYQRLPNDTDFTVFKHYGMNGVNFAFIGDVAHYHTPLDDLAHANLATLQHHGDNALGMVRALANADLQASPKGTASWFDLWGFGIVSWPEPWNLPLGILSLLFVAIASGIHWRRGDLSASEAWRGLVLFPTAVLGAAALATLAAWSLSTVGRLPDWPAAAWAPQIGFWLIGIATGVLVMTKMGRRTGVLATWMGSLFWLGLLAILVSPVLPGATYLFLAPALVGGLTIVLSSIWRTPWVQRLGVAITVVTACAAQLIIAWSLWEAMGIPVMPVVTLLVTAVTMLALAPSAATVGEGSRKSPVIALASAGALILLAMVLPAYSEESPRALNFYFVQDAVAPRAKIAVKPRTRALPSPLAAAIEWNEELEKLYPWDSTEPSFMTSDVAPLTLSPPRIDLLEQEVTDLGRRMRCRIRSPRGADRGALVFEAPQRIGSLRFEGWDFDLQTEKIRAWYPDGRRVVRFATMPEEGIEFEVTLTGSDPFSVFVVDYSYGLPPVADPLVDSRPADVVPVGQGDLTIVHSKIEL